MNKIFCSLIFLFPFHLFAQNQIKWKKYKNTDFHFSLTIPENSTIVNDSIGTLKGSNNFVLNFPIKQNAVIIDRLNIWVKKSDTCCCRHKSCLGQKKVDLKGQSFYFEHDAGASMGCVANIIDEYAICRPTDKSCFIFSSEIDYNRPFDKEGNCLSDDVNIAVEIEVTKKVVASLKFIE